MTFESCRDRRREGASVLRQCQYVQLYILHVIDAICKEYNLPYLLEGGTLLGAMRHNGFIPWDDDLDIGMPRRDYNRFLKIAREALPADLMLCLPSDVPRTAIPFAKVRDRNSFYCECRPDIKTSDPSGIYVDIFPYDDLPRVGNWGRKLLVHACASTWARARFFYNRGGCDFPLVVLNAVLGLACQVLHGFFVSLVWLLNKLLPSRYVIACLNEGYDFYYDKALLYPAASHVFEDGEFPVPKESDRILTSQYGDWRQVPPPEQRPRHARIIVPYVK